MDIKHRITVWETHKIKNYGSKCNIKLCIKKLSTILETFTCYNNLEDFLTINYSEQVFQVYSLRFTTGPVKVHHHNPECIIKILIYVDRNNNTIIENLHFLFIDKLYNNNM